MLGYWLHESFRVHYSVHSRSGAPRTRMSACRRRRRSFAATLKQSWVRAKHDWKKIPKAFQHVQRRLTKWRPDEALRGVSDTT